MHGLLLAYKSSGDISFGEVLAIVIIHVSSDIQHAHKKPAEAVCAWNPTAVKAETVNP